jgi:phenylacetate-CoA ligase
MHPKLAANLLYFPVTRLAGEPVRRYLREYRAHDALDGAALLAHQERALEEILRHAREGSPFYGQRLAPAAGGPPSELSALSGVPLLGKDHVRESWSEMTVPGLPGRPERKTTGGSTGHPLTVLKNRDALARERAATWRAYGWCGLEVLAPQGLLWGVPHSARRRWKARLTDLVANRLRLSMFGVTEERLETFHRRLLRFRPHFLYGYVSALSTFVRYVSEAGKGLPDSVRCIITTSELLDADTRAFLEKATGVRVFNEYGCGEVGSIAHECEEGSLHVMADNLVLECIPGSGLPQGLGELVVTDLFNKAMPLIRYRVGDLGRLSSGSCPCGRPYPVLERIVGRAYDVVYDAEGRGYHPEAILYVFEDLRRVGVVLPPLQAIQRRNGELLINFRSSGEAREELERTVKNGFRDAFGTGLEIDVGWVEDLPREASGKFRVVKRIHGD